MTDDTAPDPFDADAWLAGAVSPRTVVTLRQRPDLVPVVQDLQHRLKIAEGVPAGDRGLSDETPEDLHRQLAALHADWDAASLRVTLEARSSFAIEKTRRQVPREKRDDTAEVVLYQLADAIVEPAGLTVEWLRQFRETHPPQYAALIFASSTVNTATPELPARSS